MDAGAGSPPADGGAGGTGGGEVDAGTSPGGGSGQGGGSGGGGGSADAGTVAAGPQILTIGENAIALAIDADDVYWLSSDTYPYGGGVASAINVRSMPKSGGPVSQVANTHSVQATNIVAPGNGIVWSATNCGPACDPEGSSVRWGVFTADASAPDGHRLIAATYDPSMVGVDQSTAFVRTVDPTLGVGSILACNRAGSGCTVVAHDDDTLPSVYVDSGSVYWIGQGAGSPDTQGITLHWNDATPPYAARGAMMVKGPGYTSGLRVDGSAFGLREGGRIWTGTLGGGAQMIWQAPNGNDVDINQGRVFWNQSADSQYPGCLGSANLDGTDGKCLDQGQHAYQGVRVDDRTIWFIRDGQIAKLPR